MKSFSDFLTEALTTSETGKVGTKTYSLKMANGNLLVSINNLASKEKFDVSIPADSASKFLKCFSAKGKEKFSKSGQTAEVENTGDSIILKVGNEEIELPPVEMRHLKTFASKQTNAFKSLANDSEAAKIKKELALYGDAIIKKICAALGLKPVGDIDNIVNMLSTQSTYKAIRNAYLNLQK